MNQEVRRVVVTGLGAVTPLGLNLKTSWENALNGKSGIKAITQFDPNQHSVKIAGEVSDFDVSQYIEKKEQKKMGRFIHLSLAATQMALEDSGLDFTSEEVKNTTGCYIGVGMGALEIIETQHLTYLERGPGRLSPFFIPSVITNLAAGQTSIRFGFKGPNYTVTSACASSNHSIGEAFNAIRNGECDIMITGGAEATICPLAVAGFAAMKALSTRNDQPEMASRPWDKDRDGFVMGEGAGTLVLESYEHASQRGAKIYAEVTGYGLSSDAYHMTSPSPGGVGAANAMNNALKMAEVNPEDIDYINAHGTSTPMGDQIESEAIKLVFKDHAKKLWVSSTKSMTGHCLGAAGALESIFSILALKQGHIPPTINLDSPSPECDLDYVPLVAREKSMQHVLNNSFGFGGTNACLLFSKI
ncbi:MAG: beta-ketoacyl-ACP synthase II [Bdellovibrionales bacterium]|nr:beta-ketoacyl-ACP synthase II [Bdellovibrionales bacterium]